MENPLYVAIVLSGWNDEHPGGVLPGVLVMTIFWALFSGSCAVASSQAAQRTASGVWASSFGAASLVAAY